METAARRLVFEVTLSEDQGNFGFGHLEAVNAGNADSYAQTGNGTGVSLTTDTGYFWFFSSANVEVMVKVVDGRGVNGKFWVFAAGLTNVDTLIRITDTQTGAVRTYRNPPNTAFQPIQDTSAF